MAFQYVEFSPPIENYCEVTSTSFSPQYTPYAGGIVGRSQVNGFAFTTVDDYLTEAMFQHCALGTVFSWARVEFYRTGDSGLTFLYTLSNVIISSVSSNSGKSAVGLNFGTFSAKSYDTYE
jgi:type VI protein secretion system component Hcp